MSQEGAEGKTVYTELRGESKARHLLDLSRQTGAEAALASLAVEFVYGKVWAREGLDRRGRSLVTIGVLIALRQLPELQNHIMIARRNGLSPVEIEEAIIQTAPYAGFPAAWTAAQTLAALMKDEDV